MGNAADKEVSKIEPACLQPFSGDVDVTDGVGSLQTFISQIECISKTSKWSPEETAAHALEALTGKAKTWSDNLTKESPEVAKSWEDLKSRLSSRFANSTAGAGIMSLEERVTSLRSLNQKGKENSEDFFDRVSAALHTLEQEVLESAEGASERKAMIRMHQLFTALLFTNGLQIEVRNSFLKSTVAQQTSKLPTVDEIRKCVKEIDIATKKKNAETPVTVSVTKAEVEKKKESKEKPPNEKGKAENGENFVKTNMPDVVAVNPELFVGIQQPEKRKENPNDFRVDRAGNGRGKGDHAPHHTSNVNKFKHSNFKDTGAKKKQDAHFNKVRRDAQNSSSTGNYNKAPRPLMDTQLHIPVMYNPQISPDGKLVFDQALVRPYDRSYHRDDDQNSPHGRGRSRPRDQRFQGPQQNRNQDNRHSHDAPPSYDDIA